jgi:hypothetical protein
VLSVPYTGKNDIVLIHIPKTAGTSFERDVIGIKQLLGDELDEASNKVSHKVGFKKHFQDYQNEKCYYEKFSKKDFNVMIFRNPRDHVYSQYLEIKWDPKFQTHHFTDGTRFPRNYTDEVGFDLWITFFDIRVWGVLYTGDFNTYNPINMQARYLTCHIDGHHMDKLKLKETIDDIMPKLPEAINNLHSVDLVGVTEFYPTFMCVFIYRTLNHLPKPCDCDYVSTTNSTFQTHKELHGIPRHAWVFLPPSTIEKVDNITRLDQQVYIEAVTSFVKSVEEVEKETGKKILCPGSVREAAHGSLRYMQIDALNRRLK